MSSYITWLQPVSLTLATKDGRSVQVWELACDYSDAAIWSAWAKHFREHYCLDSMLDVLREGTPYSRAEYLREMIFPDKSASLGKAIRAGDFGEILIADFIETHLGFWVPRTRYAQKTVRNESPKGADVLGLHFENEDQAWSPDDVLITCEAKTQFSGAKAKPRLQDAVTDAKKDYKRLGESLNAAKRRLIEQGANDGAQRIARFQDPIDRPYKQRFGAAALVSLDVFDANVLGDTDASTFDENTDLLLLVIRAEDFKKIVSTIYERAADEA